MRPRTLAHPLQAAHKKPGFPFGLPGLGLQIIDIVYIDIVYIDIVYVVANSESCNDILCVSNNAFVFQICFEQFIRTNDTIDVIIPL